MPQSSILENIFTKFSECEPEILSSLNKNSFATKYFQENNFAHQTNSVNDFSILNINIRSIQKNFETFKSFYRSLNYLFDIICVTETWEDPSQPIGTNSLFNLPCYTLISQPRVQKKGGGTAIFVLNSLPFQRIDQQSFVNKNIECLTIEVSSNSGKNIIITCVYRPPDGSVPSFIKSIKTLISATRTDKNMFLAGDFNIDIFN